MIITWNIFHQSFCYHPIQVCVRRVRADFKILPGIQEFLSLIWCSAQKASFCFIHQSVIPFVFFLPFPQRTVSRSSKLNFERSKSLWGASQLPSAWPECTLQVAFFCPVTTDEALPKVPCFQCTQHSTHDSANTHIEGYFFCPIHSYDRVQAEGRDREGIARGSTSSPGGTIVCRCK